MGWGEASSGAAQGRPGPLSEGGAPGGWWRAATGGGLASLSLSSVARSAERWGKRRRESGGDLSSLGTGTVGIPFVVTYPVSSPSYDMRRIKSCVQGGCEA